MKRTTRKNSRFGFGWMPDLPDNRDHLTDNLSDDFWTIRFVH
jgi:hypothetical protein